MQTANKSIFKYKGYNFIVDLTTPEYLDSLEDLEMRDDDVVLVTYPKSGTIWTQNILCLIYHEGHRNGTENVNTATRVPSIEYNILNADFDKLLSPRIFISHMPYYLIPRQLRKRKGKVIYVVRNPKDVLISFYHFSKVCLKVEDRHDLSKYIESFLAGDDLTNSWFDHVEGWWTNKDDFQILFLMYEDMKKDLRSSVVKICNFVGKSLTEKEIDDVVEKATFDNMKRDSRANCESLDGVLLDFSKGHFLRKGTVGDWKNIMTVAQNEKFDSVFKERMEKLPLKFCWDINERK